MRKISFRGKCYDDGEWIFGSLLDNDIIVTKGAVEVDEDYVNIVDEWSSVLPETIGQYTGLKDKNGKRIFEGDIIVSEEYPFSHDGDIHYVGTVEWIYSSWQYIMHCVSNSIRGISNGINDFLDNGDETTRFQVIGNIHDDIELLSRK